MYVWKRDMYECASVLLPTSSLGLSLLRIRSKLEMRFLELLVILFRWYIRWIAGRSSVGRSFVLTLLAWTDKSGWFGWLVLAGYLNGWYEECSVVLLPIQNSDGVRILKCFCIFFWLGCFSSHGTLVLMDITFCMHVCVDFHNNFVLFSFLGLFFL